MKNTAFLALLLLLGTAACQQNTLEEVEEVRKDLELNKEFGTNVEIVYSDSARLKAKLNAPQMVRMGGNEPYIEMPIGLQVLFYDSLKQEDSRLTAKYGIRHLNKQLTRLANNVVIVNVKGDTVNTEELFWDEAKDRVYSEQFVKVRTPKEIILAEGFESDVALTNYTFKKIRGIIQVKDE